MDNSHFFDEEVEEVFYEKIEKQLPEKEVEFLRNVLDEGWCDLQIEQAYLRRAS